MQKNRKRAEVDPADTWRLEDIFATHAHWETALAAVEADAGALIARRGSIAADAVSLADSLELEDRLSRQMMACYAYARMRKDQDNADAAHQAMFERASAVYHKLSAETSFVAPEISQIAEDTLEEWLAAEPRLVPFRHYIARNVRHKPHILPEREEWLLAMAGPVVEGVSDAFGMLDHVDLKYGSMADEAGETVELTGGLFSRFRESRDRRVRQDAFRLMHEAYASVGNTIATLYAAHVKGDLFYSQARGFPSALASALFGDRLETSVYTGLIAAVRQAMPAMERYLALRKRLLALDTLHIYDCYVPIVEPMTREYSFDDARALVRDGVRVLGADYSHNLDRMFHERWIDRYENEGKSGGAYAWGTYDSHPYMLLNFAGGLTDVMTLAHEAGHCMHTLYSNRRPHVDASYPIFLAEIASTVNEVLLIHHLMRACDTRTAAGRLERAFYISRLIEEFRLTVFRQTMFAEFEMKTHELAEAGEPLTAEVLCDLYAELLAAYFGPDVAIDAYMRWEWARIPHFYNAFYVFKYATGFAAAIAFCDQMEREGEPAVARYLGFLGAGGSDYPLDILRQAGLDMADGAPVHAAMAEFSAWVTELEALLDTASPDPAGS